MPREFKGIETTASTRRPGTVVTLADRTPLNLFVCDGPTLKLGDFGIVRHQTT